MVNPNWTPYRKNGGLTLPLPSRGPWGLWGPWPSLHRCHPADLPRGSNKAIAKTTDPCDTKPGKTPQSWPENLWDIHVFMYRDTGDIFWVSRDCYGKPCAASTSSSCELDCCPINPWGLPCGYVRGKHSLASWINIWFNNWLLYGIYIYG